MQNATSIALSRMIAQQNALDVVANNLANTQTPGYHAERVQFSDWIVRQSGTPTAGGGAASGTLAFTQDRATWREQQTGTLTHTGNPLDLALGGNGYFTVNTPQGPRLTRAGRFTPGQDGSLNDEAGNALLDVNGKPIRLAPNDTDVTVAADGSIATANGPLGRIGVVVPQNPQAMQAEGSRLLRADTPTSQVAKPAVVQGAVEDSNVQPIVETTRMMSMLREFQFASQFIQAESDRQQSAIDKLTHTQP
jgi:flagellar basal-body rod protein FlgF